METKLAGPALVAVAAALLAGLSHASLGSGAEIASDAAPPAGDLAERTHAAERASETALEPDSYRPFVALYAEAVIKEYEPIVQNGQVVGKGRMIGQSVTEIPIGSGTVITPDGLILTNHHVMAAYDQGKVSYDQQRNQLLVVQRLNEDMLVYVQSDNDPMTTPTKQYLARRVSFEHQSQSDVAVLRIVGDLRTGQSVAGRRFDHVSFRDPFDVGPGDDITVYGYPGRVGARMSITSGEFVNMAEGAGCQDGALVTTAAIAGGNSGGAALHDDELVGVPTCASGGGAGASFGYVHPITWAVGVLAEAEMRYGLDVPEIEDDWLRDRDNLHIGRSHVFAGGKVRGAQTGSPPEGTMVVVHRPDRTLDQSIDVFRERQLLFTIQKIKNLHEYQGLSVDELARMYYSLGADRIREIIQTPIERYVQGMSQDTRSSLQGEFFVRATQIDAEDGFFMLPLPHDRNLKLVILHQDHYPINTDLETGSEAGRWLGVRQLYRR